MSLRFFYSIFFRKKVSYDSDKKEMALFENEDQVLFLKNEIHKFENEINIAFSELAEIEKLIHDFSVIHNRVLGELVNEILKVKLDKFDKIEINTEEKQKEFDNAKKDYANFTKDYQESKSQKLADLSLEDTKLLKQYYRRACKLCHPDLVIDELKAKAESIFRELHIAYQENNIGRVLEILLTLEKGDLFISKTERLTETIFLKAEVEKLKIKLADIKKEISVLKATDTYQTLISIRNWDEYFDNTKDMLIKELDALKKE